MTASFTPGETWIVDLRQGHAENARKSIGETGR